MSIDSFHPIISHDIPIKWFPLHTHTIFYWWHEWKPHICGQLHIIWLVKIQLYPIVVGLMFHCTSIATSEAISHFLTQICCFNPNVWFSIDPNLLSPRFPTKRQPHMTGNGLYHLIMVMTGGRFIPVLTPFLRHTQLPTRLNPQIDKARPQNAATESIRGSGLLTPKRTHSRFQQPERGASPYSYSSQQLKTGWNNLI